ncbi:MAG: hypothetical protein U0Q55_10235 [Vicinamibacterales bacterium]
MAGLVSFYFAQRVAEVADARARELDLRISQQQERAANAERMLLLVRDRQLPRRTSFKAAPFRDILAEAKVAAEQVDIWYPPEDEEARSLALGIFEQLGFAGWHPQRPVPIPPDAVAEKYSDASPPDLASLSALQRVGAAGTGISFFSREFNSTLAVPLFEALSASAGSPLSRSADSRLAEGQIRLIIGVKP